MLAAMGAFAPAASAAPAGPKVVIIVGPTHGATSSLSLGCERRVRRGHQVHLERRQGLQPERDLVEGQGRGQGRVDRPLPGPRQRLAEPVHVRPQVRDQGRLRPQCDRRQRRQQHQVLRRAVCVDARPRAERGHPAEPPLLRVGQLGAGRRRRRASRPPASASRNFAAGFLKAGAQAVIAEGHGSVAPYIRGLFTTHATIEELWQSAPNFHGTRTRLPLDEDDGRDRLHRHRWRLERLLPLARRAARPHDR